MISKAQNRGKQTAWHCVCECGNEVDVRTQKLTSGITKSCGCLRHKPSSRRQDLTGQRFGRLVVESMDWTKNGTFCNCVCDCGNRTRVAQTSLKHNVTQSCGCYKTDHAGEHSRTDLTGMHIGYLTAIERITVPNAHTRYRCICDCGQETKVDGPNWLNGKTRSCGCKRFKSVGEEVIEDILTRNNISYYSQYRFNDCKNKRPLPFDFYLPDYNTCIEYQGEQHYKPIDWFEDTDDTFEARQIRDSIKRTYCNDNGISLLEIPYYYGKKRIESTIMNTLNP